MLGGVITIVMSVTAIPLGPKDAGPAVFEFGDKGDLPAIVERRAERKGSEVGDGRAVESVTDRDDTVLVRVAAGEDADKPVLRRSQKGDLPLRIQSRGKAKRDEFPVSSETQAMESIPSARSAVHCRTARSSPTRREPRRGEGVAPPLGSGVR